MTTILLTGLWIAVFIHSAKYTANPVVHLFGNDSEITLPKSAEQLYRRAYQSFRQYPPDYDQARSLVEAAIGERFFYPLAWELRSEIAFRQGDSVSALAFANQAQNLWPYQAWWLWRMAMLRMRIQDEEGSVDTMKQYLEIYSADSYKVLAVARRFDYPPDELLDKMSPSENPEAREVFLLRAMTIGLRAKDVGLGSAVWGKLSTTQRKDRRFANLYFNLLMQQKKWDIAKKAWNDLTNLDSAIYNSGFDSDLIDFGFGWRIARNKGVVASRDSTVGYKDDTSLKVEFNGTENMTYWGAAHQTFPVDKNKRYRLEVYWRGENISTRSGVFFDAIQIGDKSQFFGRVSPRFGSWKWSPVSIEFETNDKTEFVRFSVRRNKTTALDSLISGRVWFDDVRLIPIDESLTTLDAENG